MPLITLNSKSLFFVHIPKTGGSSVYSNLQDSGAQIEFIRKRSIAKVSRQHYHIELLERYFPAFKNYFCFTIIRNPWHRLLSEYVWRTKNVDFKGFEEWFNKSICLPYKNLDNHLRPQSSFVNNNINLFSHDYYSQVELFLSNFFKKNINFSKKEKVFQYQKPKMHSLLSKESSKIFLDIYEKDLKLHEITKVKC